MKSNLLKILFTITIIGVSSVYGWRSEEYDSSIFTTYRYIYTESGKSYRIFDAPKKYEKCREKNKITRGEYETKEEFEERKKLQSSDCSLYYNPHNAKIIVSSKLNYNVDKGYFTYHIDAGANYNKYSGDFANAYTSANFTFDDKKVIHIDKKYIDSVETSWRSGNLHENYGSIRIKMYSPVKKARLLKVIEDSLELRIYGDFKWDSKWHNSSQILHYHFNVKHIVLFNKEENKPVFIIE